MRFTRFSPSQILSAAGFLTPLAVVILARMVLGVGPSVAPAASPENPSLLVADSIETLEAKPLTEAQKAVLAFLREERTPSPMRSPMAKPAAPVVVEEPMMPEQFEPEPDDPSEHLILTSIIGKGDRALAPLSGKVYRVGDEVGPSWYLTAIQTAERQIVITSESGETRIMKIKTDEEH